MQVQNSCYTLQKESLEISVKPLKHFARGDLNSLESSFKKPCVYVYTSMYYQIQQHVCVVMINKTTNSRHWIYDRYPIIPRPRLSMQSTLYRTRAMSCLKIPCPGGSGCLMRPSPVLHTLSSISKSGLRTGIFKAQFNATFPFVQYSRYTSTKYKYEIFACYNYL